MLLILRNKYSTAVDINKYFGIVNRDSCKAFDVVDHRDLLRKVEKMIIRCNAVTILSLYLEIREQ